MANEKQNEQKHGSDQQPYNLFIQSLFLSLMVSGWILKDMFFIQKINREPIRMNTKKSYSKLTLFCQRKIGET